MDSTEPSPHLETRVLVHATAVEMDGNGLLIFGASGSGKSALALDLIALGAILVSDDKTWIHRDGTSLIASPPDTIAGRIEARYVGLLRLPFSPAAKVTLSIDLDRTEECRLPPSRSMKLLGQRVTLLYRSPGVLQASAILQCLLQRRIEP